MLMKTEKESIQAISALGRQFSDTVILMHQAIAQKAGLSGTDHKYLSILMQNGVMTAGALAQYTGLTTGAITGVVDRLSKMKLVKREYDKEDRRKIVLVPNYENAKKILGPSSELLRARMETLISSFSNKEKELIERYMLSTMEVMEGFTKELQKKKNK